MPVRVCISRSSQILAQVQDRKSTRLNSSHSQISYAVFCLKKKNLAHDHSQGTILYEVRERLEDLKRITNYHLLHGSVHVLSRSDWTAPERMSLSFASLFA